MDHTNEEKDFNQIDCEINQIINEKKSEKEEDYATFGHISYEIFKAAFFTILSLLFQFLVEVINLIFVGHLNDPGAMAAYGLGKMVTNVVCQAIAIGMNGAIDTLVSQAFGSKHYYLCGMFLNKGRIIQAALFIPEVIIILNSKNILIAVGQDESTAAAAQSYATYCIPGMFALTQFETVKRYLQGMKIFHLTMWIQGATMLLHILWCYKLLNQSY